MSEIEIPITRKLELTLQLLEELEGGGKHRQRWDDVKGVVDTVTEKHVWPALTLDPRLDFYRARKLDGREPFTDLSQLKALPAKKVKSYGRCHSPGKSVLYASLNLQTIYAEIGAELGDLIQVIRFKPKAEGVHAATVGEVDYVRRYGKSPFFPDLEKMVEELWGEMSELERLRFNYTDAFLSAKFRKPVKYPYEYKVTSAFSDVIYEQGVNAFFYPSVSHLGGLNIAIKGDIFDEYFEVQESFAVEIIESLGFGIYQAPPYITSKSVEGATIEFDEPVDTPLYMTFTDFLWSASKKAGGPHKALNIVMCKGCEGRMEVPMMDLVAGKEFGMSEPLGYRLNMNITFEAIAEKVSKVEPNWDFLWCEITCSDTAEKSHQTTITARDRLMGGEFSGCFFDRDGAPLPISKELFYSEM